MENFKPPAMEEVESQKKKKKTVLFLIITIITSIVGIGSYFGVKQLKIYLNYLSVEQKHQLLSNYYKALVSKNDELAKQIAPEVQLMGDYNFINTGGGYSLYIFPDINNNEDNLLFVIIDNSVTPSVSYIKQVNYNLTQKDITIQQITEMGIGRQIN